MEVSFEQLKSMVVFAHVAGRGSFSAAARHMGLSRGVVSYHIKKLEAQLDVRLLNRSTRNLALTEAGKAYYEYCQVITSQASAARQQIENFKNEPQGLLKLTCPVNLGLQLIVPALNVFKHQYPKIELDVSLSDEVINITRENIDLAIRGAPMQDSGLQAVKLSDMQTCLCAAPSYLQQHGRPQTPESLNQHQWITYQQSSGVIELSKGERSYSIKVRGSITTNNAAARTAFVEGGHGIGRIPRYDAQPKITAGQLETLLDDYQLPGIEVYGVFSPGTANTKKLRLLLDFLKAHFQQLDQQQTAQSLM